MSDTSIDDRPNQAPITSDLEVDAPDSAVESDEQAVHDQIMSLPEGYDAEIIGFPTEPGDDELITDSVGDDTEVVAVLLDPDDPDAALVQLPASGVITDAELEQLRSTPFPETMPVFPLVAEPVDPATAPAMTPLDVTYPTPGTIPDPDDAKLRLSRSERRRLLGQDVH